MSVKKLTKKTSINKLSLEKVTAEKINEIIDALSTNEKAYGSFYTSGDVNLDTGDFVNLTLTHDTDINNLTHTNTGSTITIQKSGKYKITGGANIQIRITNAQLGG